MQQCATLEHNLCKNRFKIFQRSHEFIWFNIDSVNNGAIPPRYFPITEQSGMFWINMHRKSDTARSANNTE